MKNEAPIGMPCSNEILSNPLFTPKNGESIYDQDGKFVGSFVENLSDFLPGENEEWRKVLIKQSHYGKYAFNVEYPTPYWATRKVYSRKFGTVKQILVMNITGDDLVWINT